MNLLWDGPQDAATTVLLAHGASAAMDSDALNRIAAALAAAGLRVARFEFGYMAARRVGGRRPPPRADTLLGEFRAAVEAVAAPRLLVGGKSMGGRVASLCVDALRDEGRALGLLCIGYPFHPPGRPDETRTAHLATLRSPALICQGTRDPFGTRAEVEGYALSPAIEVLFLEDGDHDLRPRKAATGLTWAGHLATAATAAAGFAARLS